jgi:two-component system, NtrC family, sensor histidine kinase HydH
MNKAFKKGFWAVIPPWIILGAVLVLVPIFVFMTFASINRQDRNTTNLMLEKGAALIRSFEAGARTGMMGMNWGGNQVQRLLSETARQPDILYILVTDTKGKVLAHSDAARIGDKHGSMLELARISISRGVKWRQVPGREGSRVFEVFRRFSPVRGHMQARRRARGPMTGDWCRVHMNPEAPSGTAGQVIFVGLDMGPVEAARKEDVRHTVVMAAILLLVGFAGVVSLFLAQAYRATRVSLSRVEAFSNTLVENMPIGLVAVDEHGGIASLNQAAEAVLARAPSKDAAENAGTTALPAPLGEVIEELRQGETLVEKEVRFPAQVGDFIPLEVIATALREQGGGLPGYVILFRDLTQIKLLKEEVARTQRLASIGRLAAGVAHEIRNPLSSIKGFATYFRDRYRDVPEDQKTAGIMIHEVERLDRAVGQLLEFARPLSIQESPTSLQDLLEHSLQLIEKDARAKGTIIKSLISTQVGKVMVDPDRIQQVLLNLYLNALEAMDKGGTLTVGLERGKETGELEITVSDTGTGIREEDLPHIFDPYFTSKPSGTGLGLAIVHKVMESHGGEVRVTSSPGAGTTVTLLLPSSKEVCAE